jgi:hypothetical protein
MTNWQMQADWDYGLRGSREDKFHLFSKVADQLAQVVIVPIL